MRVFGLDFTSAPSAHKPLTLAEGVLEDGVLRIRRLLRMTSFDRLERGLTEPGPWLAAMDFPFGMPRELAEALAWPREWTACLDWLTEVGRDDFEDRIRFFKQARTQGQRELRRTTDRLAGALSPMKLDYIPLAKMFYEGALRLHRTGLSVLPCRPTGDSRVVVEAYPALVARRLVGRRGYKKDTRTRRDTRERHQARRQIVAALGSPRLAELYGLRVELSSYQARELADDATGDLLDAVLAAIQGGWAYSRKSDGFGVPAGCDPFEGWIVDPATHAGAA